jgi:hypothetical protein
MGLMALTILTLSTVMIVSATIYSYQLTIPMSIGVNVVEPQDGFSANVTSLYFPTMTKLNNEVKESDRKTVTFSNIGDTNKPLYIKSDLPTHYTLNIYTSNGINSYAQGTMLPIGGSITLKLSITLDDETVTGIIYPNLLIQSTP